MTQDQWQFWGAVLTASAIVLSCLVALIRHFLDELSRNKKAIEEERRERQRRDEETHRHLEKCQENERKLNEEFRTMQATVLTTNTQQIERVTDTLVSVQKTVETTAARSHEDSQATRDVLEKLSDHIGDLRADLAGRGRRSA